MKAHQFILTGALLLYAAGMQAPAQSGDPAKTVHNLRVQPFYFDILNFAEYDDFGLQGRVDVYVHIPNDILTFIKRDEFYIGRYAITVLVYDSESSRLLREESWERRMQLLSFERTTNPAYYDLSQRTLQIEAGSYQIEVMFEDRESRNSYRLSRTFTAKPYDENLMGISDLMLVRDVEEVDRTKQITPHINPNVASLETGFDVFYEVYNPFQLATVDITYSILSKGKEVYSNRDTQSLKRGVNTFLANISSAGLSIGSYTLSATLYRSGDSTADAILANVDRQFIIEWLTAGAPISIVDLNDAIDQLRYYASSDELRYIRDGKDDNERRTRFEEFWESRNPTPGAKTNIVMVEYYNRVAMANQRFGHYLEGWKTDRGMTFIIYGQPDYIDRNPFHADTKPYEVWEYYDVNRRFVFVDETGFGDYRLLYPIWDERNRIR
jgi:GWxTD domain-containing protein